MSVLDVGLLVLASFASGLRAAPWDPTAADYTGRNGATLYVSKLGDNSDGSNCGAGESL
jgi:hypothetical protein